MSSGAENFYPTDFPMADDPEFKPNSINSLVATILERIDKLDEAARTHQSDVIDELRGLHARINTTNEKVSVLENTKYQLVGICIGVSACVGGISWVITNLLQHAK